MKSPHRWKQPIRIIRFADSALRGKEREGERKCCAFPARERRGMADALASWTASMGSRLLSSTGEASEQTENSAHEEEHDVRVCVFFLSRVRVHRVVCSQYNSYIIICLISAAVSCLTVHTTATAVVLPNFSSVMGTLLRRSLERGTAACIVLVDHASEKRRGWA